MIGDVITQQKTTLLVLRRMDRSCAALRPVLWRMTQGRGGLVPFPQRPAAIVVPLVDPMGELLSVLHPQSSYASRFTHRVFITAIARRGTTRTGSVRKARSG